MSLPEISRRCLACGAAVRAGARFCPQCGNPMSHEEASASPVERGQAVEPEPRVAPESWRSEAERIGEELAQQKARGSGEDARPPRAESWEAQRPRARDAATPDGAQHGASQRTHAAGQEPTPTTGTQAQAFLTPRVEDGKDLAEGSADEEEPGDVDEAAAANAREQRRRRAAVVKDNLKLRGERVRDASIVVLEEASEDSGMRFIIIVVVLFLLFLLFLFLSTSLK